MKYYYVHAASLLCSLVANCANYTEQELREGAVQIKTTIRHKYAQDVPVSIKFEMGGELTSILHEGMHRWVYIAPASKSNLQAVSCLQTNSVYDGCVLDACHVVLDVDLDATA
jgi:hypothetical protein